MEYLGIASYDFSDDMLGWRQAMNDPTDSKSMVTLDSLESFHLRFFSFWEVLGCFGNMYKLIIFLDCIWL